MRRAICTASLTINSHSRDINATAIFLSFPNVQALLAALYFSDAYFDVEPVSVIIERNYSAELRAIVF